MKLSELKPAKGSRKKIKRRGRGIGSGHGKTSCRGHKGQGSRSGGGVPSWFEGGQMPIQRRLPKRGFTNIFRINYNIINLKDLDKIKGNDPITPELLRDKRMVNRKGPIKVLGEGEMTSPATVYAKKFSKSAMKKIENAGGKAIIQ
ncbi:MAG: 50S ribosomal protein L15 [Nitrospinota bacterium]|nr:50S ribosomal protein L15 [Nitrospinota bacterium]